jgi:hypothetical protein
VSRQSGGRLLGWDAIDKEAKERIKLLVKGWLKDGTFKP